MNSTSGNSRPAASDYPFFDNGGRPIAMAHRGGSKTDSNIENTMAAFQHAIDLGYTYLETDVQATADGKLICFHDTSPERLVGMRGVIGRMDWSDVSKLRVNGREPIPLLSDVLSTWPEVRFNVDAKAKATVAPLAQAIKEHDAWDRVCVASFSPWRMRDLREALGARVAYGLTPWGVAGMRFLPGDGLKRRLLSSCGPVLQVPLHRFGIPLATRRFIDAVHRSGRLIQVWTIDDQAMMERMLDRGVDGIITDRTDRLREVFISRGLWTASTP
jgi:glycerophosphoryl diester phosphodiesterase